MRRIFLILLTIFSLLVVFNPRIVFAAGGCSNVTTSSLSNNQYRIEATGCDPNGSYIVDITPSTFGQQGQSLNATADNFGTFSVTASNLPNGNYDIVVRNSSQSGFSSPQASLKVGSTNTNASSSSINGKCGSDAIDTAIGCVPINNQNALIGFFLRWGIGIGGGIAFLLILVAGFQIMTSRGDPNRLKAGQELMTSAIAGLLLLIFSVVILRIIGFDILNISALR